MEHIMKTSRFLLPVLIIAFLFSTLSGAQEKVYWDVVSKIRDEGFNRSQVAEYAGYLSDVIGPRLSGSPNIKEAQKWLKSRMDEIGLNNTIIEPWDQFCIGWEIRHISIHMTEPDYQMIIGYPEAFTPGTDGIVAENAVIAVIEKKEDFDKYRGKLRNAVVLSTPQMPVTPRYTQDAFRHTDESLSAFATEGTDILYRRHQRGQPEQRGFRPQGVTGEEVESFYKSEGAAVILKASIGSDGTVFATGRTTNRNDRTREAVLNSIPTLSVAAEHYNRIYRILERGIPVTMEVDIRINLDGEESQCNNVIGEIRGTDLGDEIVMIGGHLDSWHTATGATDNAGAVSVVLEAMRILKAIDAAPRRTIRAGLWSFEEGGLKGSRGYVRKHFGNPKDGVTPDYDKFSVYFNMDNGTGQFRGVHMQENMLAPPIFEAWMKPFSDLRMETLSRYSNRGTDHLAFDEAGLPGFQFVQDRIDYRARTWHGSMDFFDHVLPEDLKINAVIMASFAYHAAMRDAKFPRKAKY